MTNQDVTQIKCLQNNNNKKYSICMQLVVTFLCVLNIEEKGARRWEVLLMHSYD